MRSRLSRPTVVFAALFLGLSTACFATPEEESVRRSISANEAMIRRFESQQETSSSEAASPVDAPRLEAKIALLKNENERLSTKLSGPARPVVRFDVPSAEPALPVSKKLADEKRFEDLRGEDWYRMQPNDRERFVTAAIRGLDLNGVFITRASTDYIELIDAMLAQVPEFGQEYLTEIFTFAVYDSEPQTRETIDRLRGKRNQ